MEPSRAGACVEHAGARRSRFEQEDAQMIRTTHLTLAAALVLAILLVATVPVLAADDTVKGKIKTVDVDKHELTIVDENKKEWTFTLEKDAKIQISDKAGGKLADLKADDMVTIKYEKKDGKLMATEIDCTRK
jgi:hypothetical protein